jgi:copper transport protein
MIRRRLSTVGWGRALAVVVLAPLLWLVLPAPAASAHATLLGTTPPAGYAVPTSPPQLTLDFDEPVNIGAAAVTLTSAAGTAQPLGRPALLLGGRRVSVAVPKHLAWGGYQVRWQVTAQDGDPVSGGFGFAVGAGSAVPASAASGAEVDPPQVIVLRWLLFGGFALAVGGAVGAWLTGRVVREAHSRGTALDAPEPLLRTGSALGLIAGVGLAVQSMGWQLWRLPDTTSGRLIMVETVAFGVSLALAYAVRAARLAVLRHTPGGQMLAVIAAQPLIAVAVAEGLRAHPHAHNPILGFLVTVVHLLAVAVWLGALAHVVRVARRWRGDAGWARLLGHDYARLAVILLVAVLASGTVEAIMLLPGFAALVDTTYGVVLLVKVGVVAVVITLAVLGRRRLRRTPLACGPFGRAAWVEIASLVGVLAVTALLVSVAPPGPTTTALAAPPAPTGLVVPAGTLAGEITVLAQASTGEFVAHLSTPDDGGQSGFQVAATLTLAGDTTHPLNLAGCGQGCYTAPVTWRTGTNVVNLTITSTPWHGGIAHLDIPWPPRSDPALLPTVLAAMRAVPRVAVREATTSDYSGNPGTEQPLPASGAQFVDAEPYATGGGNPVVLRTLGENNAETEIGLAFPDGQVVRLFVDTGDHRILREERVTPNHLITATFVYPIGP